MWKLILALLAGALFAFAAALYGVGNLLSTNDSMIGITLLFDFGAIACALVGLACSGIALALHTKKPPVAG